MMAFKFMDIFVCVNKRIYIFAPKMNWEAYISIQDT